MQTKKEEVIGLQAQAQALERQSAALARDRAALEGERRGLPLLLKSRQGAIERDLAALAREAAEQDAVRQIVVRAPQDGTVSAVLAEPGQSVSPASALASLIPAGAQLAGPPVRALGCRRLRAARRRRCGCVSKPSRTRSSATRLAMCCRCRARRWPRRELAGLPLSGPAGAQGGRADVPHHRGAWTNTQLRAFGSSQPLVAGMRMQADVLLERRRLIEWLFEPVLGLSQPTMKALLTFQSTSGEAQSECQAEAPA